MSVLKMGVIGVGHMGQYHANIISNIPSIDFVGISDANEVRLGEISGKYDIKSFTDTKKLLKKVDAVVIAVPTNLHYKVASEALNAGVHVLLEKPITRTVKYAQKLIDLASQKNLIFQVGHVERFNGAIQQLKHVIERPYFLEARRLAPRTPRVKDVGVVLDLMIHDIDIVIGFLGYDIQSIDAVGSTVYSNSEDVATAHLLYGNGCIVDISASRVTTNKIRTLSISQEDAYIFLDYNTQDINIHRQVSSEYALTKKEIRYSIESAVERVFIHNVNPLQQEVMHFVDCIVSGATPLVSGINDIKTLTIAKKIIEKINNNAKDDDVEIT